MANMKELISLIDLDQNPTLAVLNEVLNVCVLFMTAARKLFHRNDFPTSL